MEAAYVLKVQATAWLSFMSDCTWCRPSNSSVPVWFCPYLSFKILLPIRCLDRTPDWSPKKFFNARNPVSFFHIRSHLIFIPYRGSHNAINVFLLRKVPWQQPQTGHLYCWSRSCLLASRMWHYFYFFQELFFYSFFKTNLPYQCFFNTPYSTHSFHTLVHTFYGLWSFLLIRSSHALSFCAPFS